MTTRPAAELYPTHHPAVAWRAVGEEVVVITPHDSILHTFNATGSFIWQQARGDQTVAEIAAGLAKEFEVPEESALQDAVEFVETLAQKGLLTVSAERSNRAAHG